MITDIVAELPRLQFAVTAIYHFLFIPFTLGIAALLVVVELAFVVTNDLFYQQAVKFWGKVFGIHIVLGVATAWMMGVNLGVCSHNMGLSSILTQRLASVEGALAFSLEAIFVGLFFFGWNSLSKIQHLFITSLMVAGISIGAMWFLVSSGWQPSLLLAGIMFRF